MSEEKMTEKERQEANARARQAEMQKDVDSVMDMLDKGKLGMPVNDERGVVEYICKDCNHHEPIKEDLEKEYKAPVCSQCESKSVYIGTSAGIRSHFRLKDEVGTIKTQKRSDGEILS